MACREDKFIKLVHFNDGTVAAEFEHANPSIRWDGHQMHIETHFRLNLPSLIIRMTNLKLPKNYGKIPWTMVEENLAYSALTA